jgi:hypothetical protein
MDTGKNQEAQEVPSPKGLGGASRLEDGGQAFPRAGFIGPSYGEQSVEGMSLRDYFAAKAMHGDLASQSIETGEWTDGAIPGLAKRAYCIADAMLKARKAGAHA